MAFLGYGGHNKGWKVVTCSLVGVERRRRQLRSVGLQRRCPSWAPCVKLAARPAPRVDGEGG
jgi:hypothetical protein